MPVHPEIASRFGLLDGLRTPAEAYAGGRPSEQILRFEAWDASPALPTVTTRDVAAPGPHGPVPVRVYEPAGSTPASRVSTRPGLVWCHGGGFVGGDLDLAEADWTAREVCGRAGAVVVSVDYRLAVDGVHYPVPHDDVVAALTWVRDTAPELGIDPAGITVGGASAGGNLTAGAALRLRDRDGWLPAALVLVYAVFHPVIPAPSAALGAAIARLPELFRASLDEDHHLATNYLGGPVSSADGYAMPGLAVLDGLCPTLLIDAEYDRLRASGQAFAASLALAGVDVRRVTVPGVLHAFLNQPATLEPVDRALALIAETVRRPDPFRPS